MRRPVAPVSSATSRRAASSPRSPGPIRPLGSAQTPVGFPAGRIAASFHSPAKRRTRTPPAENSRRTLGFVTVSRSIHQTACEAASLRLKSLGTLGERVPVSVTKSVTQEACMNLQPLGDRLIVEILEEEA